MKKLGVIAVVTLLAATSCNPWQGEIDQANRERDSIQAIQKRDSIMLDQYADLISEVNSNFASIKETELGIINDSSVENLNSDSKANIQENFKLITDKLQQSKEKIEDLENKLKESNGKLGALRGTIASLKKQLAEAEKTTADLRKQLEEKDIKIAEQQATIAAREASIDSVNNVSAQQAEAIAQQDAQLHAVYYIAADKATIKAKNLLAKSLLKGAEMNTSGFTKVDMRDFSELELGVKKAAILSQHPVTSYTLLPKSAEDKNLVLKIKNQNKFWANTKFLIIQTK